MQRKVKNIIELDWLKNFHKNQFPMIPRVMPDNLYNYESLDMTDICFT